MDNIKSQYRVKNYGEVYTPPHIVNMMLDLVDGEAEKIESKFFEPACGNGNILVEILKRKLQTVKDVSADKYEFERNMIFAIGSIYAVDLLEDNVIEARERMLKTATDFYKTVYGTEPETAYYITLGFVLCKNIQQGNTLTDDIQFMDWQKL